MPEYGLIFVSGLPDPIEPSGPKLDIDLGASTTIFAGAETPVYLLISAPIGWTGSIDIF